MMKLQNIVATTNLGLELDLKKIALTARNAEYNPKRFSAVIVRIRDPKTTALIFASGKMVITGAKTEHDSRLAARKYARIVQKIGFAARFLEFKIQNMVSSCDVRFPVRLEGLVCAHAKFCSYEPELFPGLIYRMVQPKIVLLIFVSGKVVLTGAKSREDLQTAFNNIYSVLLMFKKASTTVPRPPPGMLGKAAGGSAAGGVGGVVLPAAGGAGASAAEQSGAGSSAAASSSSGSAGGSAASATSGTRPMLLRDV